MTLYGRAQDHQRKKGGKPTKRKPPKALQALADGHARSTAFRLLGFHRVYEAAGFDMVEMVGRGYASRSTAYQALSDFRDFFKCDPEDFNPSPEELLVILYGDRAPKPG